MKKRQLVLVFSAQDQDGVWADLGDIPEKQIEKALDTLRAHAAKCRTARASGGWYIGPLGKGIATPAPRAKAKYTE